MYKVIRYFLCTIGFAVCMICCANADSFKLGYVDVAKVFTTSKPALAMQSALKAKFEPQQQELKKMNEGIGKLQTQIQEVQKTAPTLDKLTISNRERFEKLGAQYQKDQADFQQKYMLFQQTLQKFQDYASALLLGRVNSIIKSLSDKGNYDLILTSSQMIYAKAKYDLTDQVIEMLKSINSDELVKQILTADKVNSTTNQVMPHGLSSGTTSQNK